MKIAKATPFDGAPKINMPSVYGGCIGKEILCRIPVIGKRPIKLQIEGLVEGLYFQNGVIKGTISEECEFLVKITAENEIGSSSAEVLFKIHEDYMLQTPLMGFTSWNAFKYKVTQKDMEETAEHLLKKGIADYDYCYVNIDSGCNMHKKGFKCGIYSTPMLTAWGCPEGYESIPGCTRGEPDILWTCVMGGIGKEHLEANNVKQWEEWGFDYLKYDWRPSDPTNADYMKKELLKSKREIAFCVTVDAREEGFAIVAEISMVLAGAFPMVHVLTKVCKKPLMKLGELLCMNEVGAAGIVASLANSIPMFGMLKDMDN